MVLNFFVEYMLSNTTSSYTNIYLTNKTKTNVIGILKFLQTCM